MGKFVLNIASFLVFLWVSQAWAGDRSALEQAFFQAYDHFYQAATDFEVGLKTVQAPAGFVYPEEDLRDYRFNTFMGYPIPAPQPFWSRLQAAISGRG